MRDLGELWDELVRTSRPWDAWNYDRSNHRSNLTEIANVGAELYPAEMRGSIEALCDQLIVDMNDPNLDNWRAHNNFCLGLNKLFEQIRRLIKVKEELAVGVAAG